MSKEEVRPYYYLRTYFTHRSGVTFVAFEDVNASWGEILSKFYQPLVPLIKSSGNSVFKCNQIAITLCVVTVISHETTTLPLMHIS